MPLGGSHIRQQGNEVGLPCRTGLGQHRLHLAPDRLSRQAESGDGIVNRFPSR